MAGLRGPQPVLTSERLVLRPFEAKDAGDVQRLAGDHAIYDTTASIPHPYEDGMAEAWIAHLPEAFQEGREVTFAVTRGEDGALLGATGLVLDARSPNGELGYWIGKPYWNQGYATEAARRVLTYAFDTLTLHRVQARHAKRNPASGRVMQKCGMRWEGELREHFLKDGRYESMVIYGLLKREWQFP